MEEFESILDEIPYGVDVNDKQRYLVNRLRYLTTSHGDNCESYNIICETIKNNFATSALSDIIFLPVRLFKERVLLSVPRDQIIKTMTSSGTSGQRVSKIYLDRTTAANQQKVLAKIVSDFTGNSRLPMIIIDCPSVVKNRAMFSARGAGILGFSIFASKKIFALNDDMQLDIEGIREFLTQHEGERILLFGFTFMIWQHFYRELKRVKEETGETFDLSNGILIHGGGWKKLINEAVSRDTFHAELKEVCGLSDIHDYYGMVEQTGCIYMECECGHLHASIFSDVIMRDPKDFSVCPVGKKGIIQVLSSIPESYPGHSLLTEDEGILLGEDDCPCGRKGKYFRVLGRIKDAEIRGCSDTYSVKKTEPESVEEQSEATGDTKVIRRVRFLLGDQDQLFAMRHTPPLAQFSEKVIVFLSDLSGELMKHPGGKRYPDIVTLGFWLRKSSLSSLQKRFVKDDGYLRQGRGVAFHIAPSNVPVNFAYSLAAGLLCGNANIVRIPSKDFPQVSIITDAIGRTLTRHEEIRPYISLVRYERDKEINDILSDLCDVRIIWGGDATIAELRRSPIRPRATEVTFADRYSLAVIDADAYLAREDKDRIARDFYNDTYLTDQNACTSPRMVIWLGKRREEAKELFWNSLHALVEKEYSFQPVMGVDKLTQICLAATAEEITGKLKKLPSKDNLLYRIHAEKPERALMDYRGNCGYFYEYDCKDVRELRELCDDTHCQTIGMIGDAKLLEPLLLLGLRGVDRVVPVGHTMDFDLVWDGYDLTKHLCREIAMR